MAEEPVVGARDEEGGDDGDAVDADPLELLREQDGLEARGHPGVDDDTGLAADLVDDLAAEPDLLVESERGEVAVGAGAHDVVAGGDLAAHLRARGGVVDRLVVVEAGDEGDEGFLGHGGFLLRPQ